MGAMRPAATTTKFAPGWHWTAWRKGCSERKLVFLYFSVAYEIVRLQGEDGYAYLKP